MLQGHSVPFQARKIGKQPWLTTASSSSPRCFGALQKIGRWIDSRFTCETRFVLGYTVLLLHVAVCWMKSILTTGRSIAVARLFWTSLFSCVRKDMWQQRGCFELGDWTGTGSFGKGEGLPQATLGLFIMRRELCSYSTVFRCPSYARWILAMKELARSDRGIHCFQIPLFRLAGWSTYFINDFFVLS